MELTAGFTKTFPGGPSIEAGFSLDLDAFSLTVLFGPSGCGKTTILRCLAGLERPERGRIIAGETTWLDAAAGVSAPARDRRVGFVFQESALFPHLTVRGNIAYGLRGWPRARSRERVDELVALTGLEDLAGRSPRQLSGGQMQRVALARALAPRPGLVLLDEPFASLDRAAREELRHGLRHLLRQLGVPAILVTHDPVDALALGDRMLLMAAGRIQREGPPADVLAPGEGLGAVVRGRVTGRIEGLLRIAAGPAELFAPDPGGDLAEVHACIRGEGVSLELGAHGKVTQRNRLAATITGLQEQGALVRVDLDAGFPLHALITRWACWDLRLEAGMAVQARIKASAIQVVPVEPG
jgi:molybdate transport system ATP-binding protein